MISDEAVKNAMDALRLIDLLALNDGGRWFLERIGERVAELESRILDEDMPPTERENLRQQRFAMKEILRLPDDRKQGFENILHSAGIKPGSRPPSPGA